jgi:hypothetical protein
MRENEKNTYRSWHSECLIFGRNPFTLLFSASVDSNRNADIQAGINSHKKMKKNTTHRRCNRWCLNLGRNPFTL